MRRGPTDILCLFLLWFSDYAPWSLKGQRGLLRDIEGDKLKREGLWTLLSKWELKHSPVLHIGCQINISLKKGFYGLKIVGKPKQRSKSRLLIFKQGSLV